jgi:murein L,D-transpeptidase YcbB/YkuD
MHDRGWKLTVDGWYGSESETVCKQFQADSTAHGWPLTVDGVVGQATWKATWGRPVS